MGYILVYQITHSSIYIYIYEKQKLRENPIKFQIEFQLESNFAPYALSNLSFKIFVPSELIQCKNWISIRI